MTVTDFKQQIHVVEDAHQDGTPHRCSGCGRSSEQARGPFVGFSAWLQRGLIIDAISGAPRERLEHLRLCAECVVRASELVDPDAADGSAAVEGERRALQRQIASDRKILAGLRAEVKRDGARIEELEARVAKLDALRASVRSWGPLLTDAARLFREARVVLWAAERAGRDLAEPREALKKARSSLVALKRAGERYAKQCQEAGLWPETQLIRERVNTELGDISGI